MFDLWQLNFKLWRIQKKYHRLGRELEKRGSDIGKQEDLENAYYYETNDLEIEIDKIIGRKLFHEARKLDVETPPSTDHEMWFQSEHGDGLIWFTPKGRASVRKLIEAEKARRFEVKTLWITKIILPLAGLLIGIIGAFTGCFAVMHKSTAAPEQKRPAYEVPIQVKTLKR